jgi:hypothetical protein
MDWSEKRHHLAGTLGAQILEMTMAKGWAARERNLRTVSFSKRGEENFVRWYS